MKFENLPLVLMTHLLPDDWISSLDGKCKLVNGPKDATEFSDDLLEQLPLAEGLLTLLTISITDQLLAKAPKLKVVSNMAVGVDNIDLDACTKRGIPVGNTPGVLTESTADLTMAILLAAARRLVEASHAAQEGLWTTWSPTGWLGADLHNATLGIIGMGKIGKAVAIRARGFGLKILYADFEVWTETWAQKASLETVLAQADFISLHVPLTHETYHLINSETIKLMKTNVIIVNASRGAVIDTQALYNALINGQIAGAALDVTDPEPLPPDHPLYSTPNCLIVPHIGSATQNTRRQMAQLACQNLLAGLENRPLPNCANPEVYVK